MDKNQGFFTQNVHDYSIAQNLREINFGDSKTVYFVIFEALYVLLIW